MPKLKKVHRFGETAAAALPRVTADKDSPAVGVSLLRIPQVIEMVYLVVGLLYYSSTNISYFKY
jgi:hypothetical protein